MSIDIVEQIAYIREEIDQMEGYRDEMSPSIVIEDDPLVTLRAILATLERVTAEERPGSLQ